jgi:PKD repeat protein
MKRERDHLTIAIVLIFLLIMVCQPVLAGNTVTISGQILSGSGPVAAFSGSPIIGTAPLSVRFSDLSTGRITSWGWDFTNDGIPDSRMKNPTYRYTRPGTYSVSLTVTGPGGSDSEVKTNYITVTSPIRRPIAWFTMNDSIGQPPLTVRFTDRSLNSPTEYSWWFGDGTGSTEKNPEHMYLRQGIYPVRLRVSNAAGSDIAWRIVVVVRGVAGDQRVPGYKYSTREVTPT